MFVNSAQHPCPVCQRSQAFGYRGSNRLFAYPGPLGDHIRSKHPKWAKKNSGSHWLQRRTPISTPISTLSDSSFRYSPVFSAQQSFQPSFGTVSSPFLQSESALPSVMHTDDDRTSLNSICQDLEPEEDGSAYSTPILVQDEDSVPWPNLPTLAGYASPEPLQLDAEFTKREGTPSRPSILKRTRTLSTRKGPDDIVLLTPSTRRISLTSTTRNITPPLREDPEPSEEDPSTPTVGTVPNQKAVEPVTPDETFYDWTGLIGPDIQTSTPISNVSPSPTLISLLSDTEHTIVAELSPKSAPPSPFTPAEPIEIICDEALEACSLSPSESRRGAIAAFQSALNAKPRLPLITTGLPIKKKSSRAALLSRFDLPGGIQQNTSNSSDGWPSHSPDVSAAGTLTPLPPLPSPVPGTPDSDQVINAPLSAIPEVDEVAPPTPVPRSATSVKSVRFDDDVKIEDIREEAIPFNVFVEDSPVETEHSWTVYEPDLDGSMLQAECLPDMSMQSADIYPSIPTVPTKTKSLLHCRACGKDPCEETTATMCGHIFCNKCIVDAVVKTSRCPKCCAPALLYCLFRLDLSV